MTLNLTIQKTSHTDFTPRITVIGVGGGGCNAVNNMITLNLPGVDFVSANTDAQQLQRSLSERRIQLGPHLTQGNGAGGGPGGGRGGGRKSAALPPMRRPMTWRVTSRTRIWSSSPPAWAAAPAPVRRRSSPA